MSAWLSLANRASFPVLRDVRGEARTVTCFHAPDDHDLPWLRSSLGGSEPETSLAECWHSILRWNQNGWARPAGTWDGLVFKLTRDLALLLRTHGHGLLADQCCARLGMRPQLSTYRAVDCNSPPVSTAPGVGERVLQSCRNRDERCRDMTVPPSGPHQPSYVGDGREAHGHCSDVAGFTFYAFRRPRTCSMLSRRQTTFLRPPPVLL